jgi:hypothetical protein
VSLKQISNFKKTVIMLNTAAVCIRRTVHIELDEAILLKSKPVSLKIYIAGNMVPNRK